MGAPEIFLDLFDATEAFHCSSSHIAKKMEGAPSRLRSLGYPCWLENMGGDRILSVNGLFLCDAHAVERLAFSCGPRGLARPLPLCPPAALSFSPPSYFQLPLQVKMQGP